ncbi:MAG: hypothetical protein A2665_00405 [Candidatus Zambryskibacteria bacterium RIFCSPHIGHO2_01_FULL_46_30]|uniref:YqgF/RNase H-like domain-containing protein n=1 Tax=Candidatus Zambryskibacteria bacterium RIFCSPHIGHO2_01_FULL_46_30 TaxID=1802739 RepID=A0A1G2T737_9BACT|nr:MAG: hypothetical protein A2665_00405 [Candidatus Zambryskibacteria bacterium RIFCSPHIGHO2_01_FULL_46_30]
MAIDYGKKRVGIASTDETGDFALPRAVWPNDETLVEKILKLQVGEQIEKIIIGESRNLDGSPNPIQKDIDNLKNELAKHGVEIVSHPEVFTTLEARRLQPRRLRSGSRLKRRESKNRMTDASAATLILKSFIDTMYNREV